MDALATVDVKDIWCRRVNAREKEENVNVFNCLPFFVAQK